MGPSNNRKWDQLKKMGPTNERESDKPIKKHRTNC